jgi:hypothetical protein
MLHSASLDNKLRQEAMNTPTTGLNQRFPAKLFYVQRPKAFNLFLRIETREVAQYFLRNEYISLAVEI